MLKTPYFRTLENPAGVKAEANYESYDIFCLLNRITTELSVSDAKDQVVSLVTKPDTENDTVLKCYVSVTAEQASSNTSGLIHSMRDVEAANTVRSLEKHIERITTVDRKYCVIFDARTFRDEQLPRVSQSWIRHILGHLIIPPEYKTKLLNSFSSPNQLPNLILVNLQGVTEYEKIYHALYMSLRGQIRMYYQQGLVLLNSYIHKELISSWQLVKALAVNDIFNFYRPQSCDSRISRDYVQFFDSLLVGSLVPISYSNTLMITNERRHALAVKLHEAKIPFMFLGYTLYITGGLKEAQLACDLIDQCLTIPVGDIILMIFTGSYLKQKEKLQEANKDKQVISTYYMIGQTKIFSYFLA